MYLAVSVSIALCFGLIQAQGVQPPRQPHQPLGGGKKILTYEETVVNANFTPESTSIDWFSGGEDGTGLALNDNGDITLENFVTGSSSIFVAADLVPSDYWEYWIRSDLEKVMFATNYTKQYRHSYFANYEILDVASGETTPLVEDQDGDIQYAEFAPSGDLIAFVRGNNLYLTNVSDSEVTQITFDGGPDMFHAVPDWVYEEEILGDRFALWWSPDASFIAYLSFNETGVGTFTVPYYMADDPIAPPYPRELELRYPKVGTTNPTVAFNLLDVNALENTTVPITAFDSEEAIIGEVAWVTEDHSRVIYRVFNRVQDHEAHVLVDVESADSRVVRTRDGSDGWLDNLLSIAYIGSVNGSTETYYADISDASGWAHLYLFPTGGGDHIPLTSGEWEVITILSVDTDRELIYYTSTQYHSAARHVYSVSYTTGEITPLVNDSEPGRYSASFSSSGGYYLLTYGGPDVPYQELYSVDSSKPLRTITNNSALYESLQEYNLPEITYLELEHPEGFTLSVMQRLPPNFKPFRKYPVLFTPYGGPGAQEVSMAFQALDWNAYIASDPELEYITWTVDGRGTGGKGRAFRSTVASHLGRYEPLDQIWAAEQMLEMYDFVDPEKIGMWGWSFGGYLTAKVLEANSGVFTSGWITAPVSDWRFYDSMYTERYMKTYEMNPAGYNETAVRNTTGFANVSGKFSIMHGTGDDNVHYQNTAALIDLLVGAGVSPAKMDMMAFTDSDHSINYNGATAWLYRYLTGLLYEEKMRVPDENLAHQWSRKKRSVEWKA